MIFTGVVGAVNHSFWFDYERGFAPINAYGLCSRVGKPRGTITESSDIYIYIDNIISIIYCIYMYLHIYLKYMYYR